MKGIYAVQQERRWADVGKKEDTSGIRATDICLMIYTSKNSLTEIMLVILCQHRQHVNHRYLCMMRLLRTVINLITTLLYSTLQNIWNELNLPVQRIDLSTETKTNGSLRWSIASLFKYKQGNEFSAHAETSANYWKDLRRAGLVKDSAVTARGIKRRIKGPAPSTMANARTS